MAVLVRFSETLAGPPSGLLSPQPHSAALPALHSAGDGGLLRGGSLYIIGVSKEHIGRHSPVNGDLAVQWGWAAVRQPQYLQPVTVGGQRPRLAMGRLGLNATRQGNDPTLPFAVADAQSQRAGLVARQKLYTAGQHAASLHRPLFDLKPPAVGRQIADHLLGGRNIDCVYPAAGEVGHLQAIAARRQIDKTVNAVLSGDRFVSETVAVDKANLCARAAPHLTAQHTLPRWPQCVVRTEDGGLNCALFLPFPRSWSFGFRFEQGNDRECRPAERLRNRSAPPRQRKQFSLFSLLFTLFSPLRQMERAIPGVLLVNRAFALQRLMRQQPKGRAEIIVRRRRRVTARPHHRPADLQRLRHMQGRCRRGVARVCTFVDQITVVCREDRQAAANQPLYLVVKAFKRAPMHALQRQLRMWLAGLRLRQRGRQLRPPVNTGGVIGRGRLIRSVRQLAAQVVDLSQGPALPRLCRQREVEFTRKRRTLPVGCVVGIVRGPVARIVVDRQPDRLVEQRIAANARNLLGQRPIAFRRQGGDGRQAAPLQNCLHIRRCRPRRHRQRIGWQPLPPPESGPVRFAVEFKVTHARLDQLLHRFQFRGRERAGSRRIPHDLDDRHDLPSQQRLRQLQRVALVRDLYPLDAQLYQFPQPELFHHLGRRRANAGAPVDTDTCVICRAGIGVQIHESALYSGSQPVASGRLTRVHPKFLGLCNLPFQPTQ